jgi:hypothetical protein
MTYRPESGAESRRTLNAFERAAWQAEKRERRRLEDQAATLRVVAILLLGLLLFIGTVAGCSRTAQATGWGTLPEGAYRLCFVDDGAFDCLNRVSDFDTLRFCPGTGDALNQPAPPGLLLVGFTDAYTGTFTVVRQQVYQWRQYQAYEGRIVVGLDETVAGSFSDGFETCDEYRT